MLGNMMQWPLLVSSVFRHATTYSATQEIVSVTADQPLLRVMAAPRPPISGSNIGKEVAIGSPSSITTG